MNMALLSHLLTFHCEGRQPWSLRHLPDSRGHGVSTDVRGNPVADRQAAGAARASVKVEGLKEPLTLLFC
jgi:hypothetical protein